jgi:autotransporter-associated beta strand protein
VVIVDSDVVNNNLTGGVGGNTIAPGGNMGTAGMTSGQGIFIEGASTLTLSTATTQTVSGNIGGGGQMIKDGAGVLVLTGTNNYTGGTSIRSGTVTGNTFGIQGDIANSGQVIFNQNIASGTYTGNMTGTGGVNITGTGTVIFAGTNTYTGGTTVDSGTLQGTTSSLTGTITNNSNLVFNQSFTGTYSGVITSTGGVTVSGPGTVIFTGANNYTGGTTIAGGTLQGNTTSLTGTMTNNGRLIFDQAAGGTFAGPITGTGNVVKQGAGTLVLTGTNTYSGGTTVSAGTLEGTTANVQGNIVNDSLVRFNQATTGTYGGSMSGSGGVNVTGGGVYVFTGTNTYSGGTTVDSGELRGTTSSLQGNIANNSEVTFNQGFTGAYGGVISGTGAVNITGTGTVAFTGANTYSGGTTVSAGTLQGTTTSLQGSILNNANVRFVNNVTGTFNGTISGTGGVNINGAGTVAFGTDQTYTGNTNIQNGTLRLNASLTNDVIVAAPGTLAGNGFINGDVTLGGTMDPGNSIGTMTINGNYTTSSGSVQRIEIAPGGNTPGVHNDVIVVNGNVTLSGGTVSVVSPTSGGFGGGTKYTFLQHTGTRSGTFDGISTNSAFLNATLVYDPNAVAFVIARNATMLRDVAQTFNQRQVATYLDQNNLMAQGDIVDVLDQILGLNAAGARSAFDQLTGQIYGSAAQANFQNVTLMYNMLRRNVRNDDELGSPVFGDGDIADSGAFDSDIMLAGYSPDGRAQIVPVQTTGMRRRRIWNAWTTSYGSGNESDDDIGFYGAGGTMLSIYRNLDDAWKFGTFGAYNYVSLRTEAPARQRVQQNNGQFGTYLRGDDGVNYLLWATSMGFDNYESSRQLQFGNITRTASGDHEGWQYSSYFEYGRQFNLWPFDIEPFMALQYAYSRQNAFTETGAGAVNLQVGGVDADSLRTVLGSRLLWDVLNLAGKPVRPELHIAWIHELLDETTTFNSVFAGVGGTSFATQGTDFGRNWGLFGGGVNFAITDRILLAGHYDMQTNAHSTIHLGSATMQVRW